MYKIKWASIHKCFQPQRTVSRQETDYQVNEIKIRSHGITSEITTLRPKGFHCWAGTGVESAIQVVRQTLRKVDTVSAVGGICGSPWVTERDVNLQPTILSTSAPPKDIELKVVKTRQQRPFVYTMKVNAPKPIHMENTDPSWPY